MESSLFPTFRNARDTHWARSSRSSLLSSFSNVHMFLKPSKSILEGLNTLTSKGYRAWEVWLGSARKSIPICIAWLTMSRVTWRVWPSIMSRCLCSSETPPFSSSYLINGRSTCWIICMSSNSFLHCSSRFAINDVVYPKSHPLEDIKFGIGWPWAITNDTT